MSGECIILEYFEDFLKTILHSNKELKECIMDIKKKF